ncbi:putative serine/threonine-protein kinase At1g54610 [Apium graveolens]|uniref:putative serine/threonine-protein kinase At1g54610 n=1 Tax=Apium graveolens TaxID=4045 RepID=UPI003D79EBA8
MLRIFMICGSPSEDYWRKLKRYPAGIIDPQKHFTRRVAEIFKAFPAPALALLETLLSIDPSGRKSAVDALNCEFFRSEPLPSKPEELPECPDETRMFIIEAAGGNKGNIYDIKGEGTSRSRAIPALRLNAELYHSMLKGLR